MSNDMLATIKRTRPIWVARAILFYLLYVNIKHQQKDYGGWGIDSWLYAFAMEVSVSVGLSAIITILVTSRHPARFLILLFVPVLYLGIEQSVAASQRIFLADKTEQISGESMSLEARMANNNFIGAGNALQKLRDLGVTSGQQYSNARADYERAKSEWETAKTSTVESSSKKALEATTGGDVDADEAALEVATKRAWLLMGFVLLFSAVSGLWTLITAPIDWEALTGAQRPKKPQGSSRPNKKEAVELVDFGVEDVAPKTVKPSKQAGEGGGHPRKEGGNKSVAKKVAREIKGGRFTRSNGEIATDMLSQRDLASYTQSKKSQASIMGHLEAMGVVEKQGGNRAARITDDYQPEVETGNTDEVAQALIGLGFKKADAQQRAKKAEGTTVEERVKNALKNSVNRQLFDKGQIATTSGGRVLVAD